MSVESTPALAGAYAFCRAVAKREAKNFYWAFRALPQEKSDAMCAVYAFMRKADDLSDDESLSLEERRGAMAAWTAAWRASRHGGAADPLFVAVNDVQRRFGIADALLDQLVAGTTMDLEPQLPGVVTVQAPGASGAGEIAYQAYESFDALYRYCYLVASVVGLVTIRIFGYSGAEAELLAERTGVAFQLTNILRDVREDAERGRLYLPLEDMERSALAVPEFVADVRRGEASLGMRGLLQSEVTRAQELYQAADALIPMIDGDARPAMRVLVTIYRRLLERIAADPAAVLRERVSVPTAEKLLVLGGGLAEAARMRWR